MFQSLNRGLASAHSTSIHTAHASVFLLASKMACVSVAAAASRVVAQQKQHAPVTSRVGKAHSAALRASTKKVRARRNVVTRASDESAHPEGAR